MADAASSAEVLRDRDRPEPAPPSLGAPPTPLYRSASDLLGPTIERRLQSGDREAAIRTQGAEDDRRALRGLEDTQAAQKTERDAARPTPPTMPETPSVNPRAFLDPGKDTLNQLQAAMLGLGQLSLGFSGATKGHGYAIAAVSAYKGALEGWQHGDKQRIDASLTRAKAETDRLLHAHKLARETYTDLVEDQKRTMEEQLGAIELRARINGNEALAEAARGREYNAMLSILEKERGNEIQLAHNAAQIEQWRAQAARDQRNFEALEQRRRELQMNDQRRQDRADRALKLREETNANVIKLEKDEIAANGQLDALARVKEAVAVLHRKGVLQTGPTWLDKGRSTLALQSAVGDEEVSKAVNDINRYGTGLVIGTELSLGATAGAMRLKAVNEAEVGNLIGAPKIWWDSFLSQAEKQLGARRELARRHLDVLGRAGGGTVTRSGDDAEILSTEE